MKLLKSVLKFRGSEAAEVDHPGSDEPKKPWLLEEPEADATSLCIDEERAVWLLSYFSAEEAVALTVVVVVAYSGLLPLLAD